MNGLGKGAWGEKSGFGHEGWRFRWEGGQGRILYMVLNAFRHQR